MKYRILRMETHDLRYKTLVVKEALLLKVPQVKAAVDRRLIHQSPLVQKALQRSIEERLRRKGHRADATIEGLLKFAHFDVRKLFNDEWDDETALPLF